MTCKQASLFTLVWILILKEAERILDGKKPDEDAQTRGQQKQIEELKKEKTPEPPAKKSKLTKDSTMAATAKVGMVFSLDSSVLGVNYCN